MPRLVHRRTGSVVVVSDEKAEKQAVSLATLGFEPESKSTAKAPAKKAAASSKSSK